MGYPGVDVQGVGIRIRYEGVVVTVVPISSFQVSLFLLFQIFFLLSMFVIHWGGGGADEEEEHAPVPRRCATSIF